MKAWGILLSYLLAYVAAAQDLRIAPPSSTPAEAVTSFSRLANDMAQLPPVDGAFPARAVVALRLTVLRQLPDSADERTEVYTASRDAGAAFPATILEAQVQAAGVAMASMLPSSGMHSCGNDEAAAATTPLYLAAELTVLVAGHRPLRLRSDASCAHKLPWNVSNGASLYAITAPAPGMAVMALAQAICQQCLPAVPVSLPAPITPAPQALSFDQLYADLIARWRRLGHDHAAYEIKLQTYAYSEALDWMDHERFRLRLADSERHERGTVRAMAHELLRPLLSAAPSCAGRTAPAGPKYNKRQARCSL